MTKGTIYIVRHGMTEANKLKSFQGNHDIPLNEEGLRQARALAEHFKDIPLDAVYSSPLQRAYKTAEILAETKNLSVNKVYDLREICFGAWEGVDYEEVQRRWPEEQYKFLNCPSQCRPEGGETMQGVQKRVHDAFAKILAAHDNYAQIAIVMHGGAGRLLLCDFLGLPIDRMWKITLGNCSVTTINNWDGNMVLEGFNDHHFLPDSGDFLKSFLALQKK
ncbi:MAG: alpha-ribazole phosphatase [Acidaminococcaceae bacterium]|nr:alpha-ribazole phosphatase [Acidaminococcaceae bacterium]